MEARAVVYSTTSFSPYKQECPACFVEEQRGVSIRMPLGHQSVCIGFLSQKLQDRIKQHVSKSIRSFSSSQKR